VARGELFGGRFKIDSRGKIASTDPSAYDQPSRWNRPAALPSRLRPTRSCHPSDRHPIESLGDDWFWPTKSACLLAPDLWAHAKARSRKANCSPAIIPLHDWASSRLDAVRVPFAGIPLAKQIDRLATAGPDRDALFSKPTRSPARLQAFVRQDSALRLVSYSCTTVLTIIRPVFDWYEISASCLTSRLRDFA
jgi:hypothetical protein